MLVMTPQLEKFVQVSFDTAYSQMQEGKQVLQDVTLFASNGGERLVIAPILSTVDILGSLQGIPVLPSLIQGIWAKLKAETASLELVAITVLADMWVKTDATKQEAEDIIAGRAPRLSKRPDSIESIVVQLTLPEESRLFHWPYVRKGVEILFSGKPEEVVESGALFPGIWPI